MATIARFEDSDAWQTTWTVEIDVLPGCISWAPTRGEAVDMAQEAIEAWVLTAIRCGDDLPEAFMETLGVETVSPHQIRLVKPASETVEPRVQLLSVVEELSEELVEELVEEVVDFAEFLRQQRQRRVEAATPVSIEHRSSQAGSVRVL